MNILSYINEKVQVHKLRKDISQRSQCAGDNSNFFHLELLIKLNKDRKIDR